MGGSFHGYVSHNQMVPICEPWCWYIYLQNWDIFRAHVGRYSSTMEHMGYKWNYYNEFYVHV